MFELLFALGLIVCAVMLTVGLFKLIFVLLLLPVKIVGSVLHLVVSLVVGIIGIIVTVVLLPVLAVVAIPLVFNPGQTSRNGNSGVPRHGATGPGHIAFRVEDEEVEDWKAHLRAQGVEIEKELSWPGGGRSLYFRDPAGNSVELATARLWGL